MLYCSTHSCSQEKLECSHLTVPLKGGSLTQSLFTIMFYVLALLDNIMRIYIKQRWLIFRLRFFSRATHTVLVSSLHLSLVPLPVWSASITPPFTPPHPLISLSFPFSLFLLFYPSSSPSLFCINSLSSPLTTSLLYAFSISCPLGSSCLISFHLPSNLFSTSSLPFAFSLSYFPLLEPLLSVLSLVPSLISLLPVSSTERHLALVTVWAGGVRWWDGRRTVWLWPIQIQTLLLRHRFTEQQGGEGQTLPPLVRRM